MISVKIAVQKAEEYLTTLISNVSNIMLEEVELTDDEKFWFVTLSYNAPTGGILNVFGKTVKVFKIKRDSGEVTAMKMRNVNE